MAFALTSFEAFSIQMDEPIQKRALQCVRFTVTALAADVDFDFGDVAGTFWTAAIANATYGTSATTAKTYWTSILSKAASIVNMYSFEIAKSKTPAGASAIGAGLVKYNGTALTPEILFNAAEGITAITLTVILNLQNSQLPVTYAY
jgi:hypothetical protein